MTDTIIEETWWEVTTTTGLTLRLPAPLSSSGQPMDPAEAIHLSHRMTARSESKIEGRVYGLDLKPVVFIQQFTRKHDPTRLTKSQMRAAGVLRTSSESGPDLS